MNEPGRTSFLAFPRPAHTSPPGTHDDVAEQEKERNVLQAPTSPVAPGGQDDGHGFLRALWAGANQPGVGWAGRQGVEGVQVGKGKAGFLGRGSVRLSPRGAPVEALDDERVLEGVLRDHEQSVG